MLVIAKMRCWLVNNPEPERTYSKPQLDLVLVRVDYGEPIIGFRDELPATVRDAALSLFPIPEPKPASRGELVLHFSKGQKADVIKDSRIQLTQWLYHGLNNEKTLEIDDEHLAISYKRYDSHASLRKELAPVTAAIADHVPGIRLSRLGLRYVNRFRPDDKGQPTDWTEYIDSRFLGGFGIADDPSAYARVWGDVEIRYEGDVRLHIRYGMPNPDYPASITKKEFILDIDSFYRGAAIELTSPEVERQLGDLRSRCRWLFNVAIREPLKEMLR
jgi:uncharacterized protein (TIGR04255 family)